MESEQVPTEPGQTYTISAHANKYRKGIVKKFRPDFRFVFRYADRGWYGWWRRVHPRTLTCTPKVGQL